MKEMRKDFHIEEIAGREPAGAQCGIEAARVGEHGKGFAVGLRSA